MTLRCEPTYLPSLLQSIIPEFKKVELRDYGPLSLNLKKKNVGVSCVVYKIRNNPDVPFGK